jgi:hypothetical protein
MVVELHRTNENATAPSSDFRCEDGTTGAGTPAVEFSNPGEPMSTNAFATQNDSGAPFDRLLTTHVYLGRDRTGRDHHLDRATASVHWIDPDTGARVRRPDLTSLDVPAPRAPEHYIEAVATEIGWDDHRKYVGADLFGGFE